MMKLVALLLTLVVASCASQPAPRPSAMIESAQGVVSRAESVLVLTQPAHEMCAVAEPQPAQCGPFETARETLIRAVVAAKHALIAEQDAFEVVRSLERLGQSVSDLMRVFSAVPGAQSGQ